VLKGHGIHEISLSPHILFDLGARRSGGT